MSGWKPFQNLYARVTGDDERCFSSDAAVWSRDIGNHYRGEFSYAVVRANAVIEDYSQVDTSPNITYVGIYDGHGGSEASIYVRDHLFDNLVTRLEQNGGDISDDLIEAFSVTENGFIDHVRVERNDKPLITTVGSCCLVGVISGDRLYVANLGDSRAVLGQSDRRRNRITAVMKGQSGMTALQLTEDHNASDPRIRDIMLQSPHNQPDTLVRMNDGITWRVKWIIQVTRAIGDAHLKAAEFFMGNNYPEYNFNHALQHPALSAVPAITVRTLEPNDRFVIFASDGLWEHITNEKAVKIVKKHGREGAAKKLVKKALEKANRKKNMRYRELVEARARRSVHDDITVIVLFIDWQQQAENVNTVSVKAYSEDDAESEFQRLAPPPGGGGGGGQQ